MFSVRPQAYQTSRGCSNRAQDTRGMGYEYSKKEQARGLSGKFDSTSQEHLTTRDPQGDSLVQTSGSTWSLRCSLRRLGMTGSFQPCSFISPPYTGAYSLSDLKIPHLSCRTCNMAFSAFNQTSCCLTINVSCLAR